MTIDEIQKVSEDYEELSDEIEGKWRQLIGWGCGHFVNWELYGGNQIAITYDRPRNGGQDIDYIDLEKFL